jgi:hypothetical protein
VSYAYGALVHRAREGGLADDKVATETNKYVALIAAIVPADVLAVHAIVLGLTTTTDASGTTTITNADLLKTSFLGLLVLSVFLYLIARGITGWKGADWVLFAIPPLAFVAWTGLIGTSALTPWVSTVIPKDALIVLCTILAVILIAIQTKLRPV